MSSVPVMSEVVGSERLPNGSLYNYHHIFTMSRLIPAAEFDYGDMQTPESVCCPGRKSGKAPPALPDRFYYKVEIAYPDLGAVAFEEVRYISLKFQCTTKRICVALSGQFVGFRLLYCPIICGFFLFMALLAPLQLSLFI
ncbi:uncharacterized protein LOC127867544 [Dreissena polymorpha]|uniref:uncharacterized protein LOC127867544 n=1 Tax=Dreissena polymorpha TaxID=45954 RepID=UPI002264950B|nr:uncharacterized protein LOC127867544 [Dreissena polymorpha]